jgi:hypothetical protein
VKSVQASMLRRVDRSSRQRIQDLSDFRDFKKSAVRLVVPSSRDRDVAQALAFRAPKGLQDSAWGFNPRRHPPPSDAP